MTNGTHLIADLRGCDAALLDDADFLASLVEKAAKAAGATVLDIKVQKFEPQGVTAIALLAESHLSIHTWPEHGYAGADVFTCGDTMTPEAGIATIKAALKATDCRQQSIKREIA
jgi:S-adenosylmethionine decarboxylase